MNANRLAQDAPCVIDIIRRHFLYAPPPSNIPYKLDFVKDGNNYDPSESQKLKNILKYWGNKVILMIASSSFV